MTDPDDQTLVHPGSFCSVSGATGKFKIMDEPRSDVTAMPADQFDALITSLDLGKDVPSLRRAWWRRWLP
jgi:hypothetical protein